jgi:hypothetical protein
MFTAIEFDKPRRLRFDVHAFIDLEQALGKPIQEILKSMGLNEQAYLLWAGLKHEDKHLTPSLVKRMFNDYVEAGRSAQVLMTALNDAVTESAYYKSITTEAREGNGAPPTTATAEDESR